MNERQITDRLAVAGFDSVELVDVTDVGGKQRITFWHETNGD